MPVIVSCYVRYHSKVSAKSILHVPMGLNGVNFCVPRSVSCRLLMWGYTRSPVNEGVFREEWQSVLTNFGVTVVPSLLFGALISATDPGELR